MITRLTLSAGALVLAASGAQAQAYNCPSFGDVDVRITLIEGTDAAVAEFIAGTDNPSGDADPVTMRAQRGVEGIAFAGGDLVLQGPGDVATLTAGDVTIPCTLEGADPAQAEAAPAVQPVEQPVQEVATPAAPEVEALPEDDAAETAAAETAPVETPQEAAAPPRLAAISLGGNLRAGPGTDFADVGGLDEGSPITLLEDTGVVFNGYNWWQIEVPSGDIAFQWGGVICVPGGGVAGLTNDPAQCGDPADATATTEVIEATPQPANALNIQAISQGGNLRSGLGTAFPDIGGLVAGDEIVLLSDTGIPFNGYHWWEIQQPNGEVAFQWGGVICVPAGGVSGVLDACP